MSLKRTTPRNKYIGQTSRPDYISYPNGQKTVFDYFGTAGDLRLKIIHNLKVGTNPASTLSRFDYTYSPDGEMNGVSALGFTYSGSPKASGSGFGVRLRGQSQITDIHL